VAVFGHWPVGSHSVHFVPCLNRVSLHKRGKHYSIFSHLDGSDFLCDISRHVNETKFVRVEYIEGVSADNGGN
jgi:hypothetical protein